MLTHDPKFDVPLLEVALRRPAAYIGAMGSRRTHDDRLRRLREAGLTDDELARLHCPIGLDLGARTAEETAVSIAAEIVQARWGGSGMPLSQTVRRHPRGRAGAGVSTAGLLLAAGAGRRMGGPKALLELDGEPLVRRGVRLLRDGGCDPVLVVVGAAAEEVVPLCDGAEVVPADRWESGMAASLRSGLAALTDREPVTAVVVALVDQPGVSPEAVRRLRAAGDDGALAAVATYDGRRRNPVLLGRACWPEVWATATGDEGARSWLRSHREQVVVVDCSDAGDPYDLDSPDDLARPRGAS